MARQENVRRNGAAANGEMISGRHAARFGRCRATKAAWCGWSGILAGLIEPGSAPPSVTSAGLLQLDFFGWR